MIAAKRNATASVLQDPDEHTEPNKPTVNASSDMGDGNEKLKDFEKSMQQLEKIVSNMESGELSLDESLGQFESGIKLAKICQDTLANAEMQVTQLIQKNGLQQTVPFEDLDEN